MSLKNREQFSSTLDTDLKAKLKELSSETKVPISKLLDEAVILLLSQRGLPRDNNRELNNTEQLPRDEPYKININLPDDSNKQ